MALGILAFRVFFFGLHSGDDGHSKGDLKDFSLRATRVEKTGLNEPVV